MPVVPLMGAFGSGKSTYIKGRLKGMNPKKKKMCLALVKNDYKFDISRDPILFFKEAVNTKDTVIVIDEAAVMLPSQIPKVLNPNNPSHQHILRIITTFINARKLNNFIFIIYHSMGEFPLWLLKYTNILVRFRTTDLMQYMKSRFGSFEKVVQSIEKYPTFDKFVCHEITINK